MEFNYSSDHSFGSPIVDIDIDINNASSNNSLAPPVPATASPASLGAIISLSFLFCGIGLVGIAGNILVIYIILGDRKMRSSVTNLFIMNLAVSDLLIMLMGIPEITLFMVNRGWLLGQLCCKLQRFVLVTSLYSSVLTLVAVCVERFIAIVLPMQAHIVCSRSRTKAALGVIWPVSAAFGLPTPLYNVVLGHHSQGPAFCRISFPPPRITNLIAFKYTEFTIFYVLPLVIQVILYTIVGKRLFAGSDKLHRNVGTDKGKEEKDKSSEAIKARKGVVKMLIASVTIYFISYSPPQALLIYNTVAPGPFKATWPYVVFVMTMGYINSAANPVLYCIFSQNFRRRFSAILCCNQYEKEGYRQAKMTNTASRYNYSNHFTMKSTAMTETVNSDHEAEAQL